MTKEKESTIVEELQLLANLAQKRPIRLHEFIDIARVLTSDEERHVYGYGQPLAIVPLDNTRWGVFDFRPIVHDGIRHALRKPTRVHDAIYCMNFIERAKIRYGIKEGEGSTIMVIDTFIDDVYDSCVYRSQENVEFYGTWHDIMTNIENRSFLRNFRDYLGGEFYDTFDVKRVGPRNAELITVDTIHATTYGGGNDLHRGFEDRYVIVHWMGVASVQRRVESRLEEFDVLLLMLFAFSMVLF